MHANEFIDLLKKSEAILPIIAIALLITGAAIVLAIIILNLLDFRRLWKRDVVFIELTPPAQADKSVEATQHLFSVLHGMEESRSLIDKLLRRKVVFASEIVSTLKEGIRYILCVPANAADVFERTIASYTPETKIHRIDDYTPNADLNETICLSFRQSGHFAYPLQASIELEENDPIAYINGAMTKLQPDELVALQIIASPAKIREAGIVQNRLVHNEELVTQLGKRRLPIGRVFEVINTILFSVVDGIGDLFHGSSSRSYSTAQKSSQRKQDVAAKIRPARTLSPIEEELAESVNNKLRQPLFRVDVRAIVIMQDAQQRKQRTGDLRNALDAFKTPGYQSLKARFNFPLQLRGRYRLAAFRHRLPSLSGHNANILSSSELASIYHFPHSESAKTENLVKSLSRTLPAPLALKSGTKFDVILGNNHHLGTTTGIGMTTEERERHVFVVGGTGNGKTTLLKYAIVQDIKNGKGVAVIDPHGDLAKDILKHIPEDRINDVVYFNPADLAYPVGLNLLEIPEGLEGDELITAKDFITEAVVSIMRKTFSEDGTGGHRIEYVLRCAIHTALTVENATLFTIHDLLTDSNFRKPIVAKLKNKMLKNFWNNEYGKAGDYQQVKMMGGVTSKIGRYQLSASTERTLGQPKSTIDFNEILDGKILICNLAKGTIGEDTSEVFGTSILTKLQLAAYHRVNQEQTDRQPFYLYVDEFQNFATTSFMEILSEARKYKLFLTMAEQSISQQEDKNMVNIIFDNVGTIICFKSSSPTNEKLILPIFDPYVKPGEIACLPAFNFYIRLAGVLQPQEPTSGVTILLPEKGNNEIATSVIAASRTNYATKYAPPTPVKTDEKSKTPAPKSGKKAKTNKTITKSKGLPSSGGN